MKNLNRAVALANASDRSVKVKDAKSKPEEGRYTLDRRKLYLDSCATYHSFVAK